MSDDDTEYYRQRATAERTLALQADRRDVAEIHLELARLYEALVDQKELRTRLLFPDVDRSKRSA
jgi:hypothetical protein